MERRIVPSSFTPVDLARYANVELSSHLPDGELVLAGIPFSILTGSFNAWSGSDDYNGAPGHHSLDIDVDQFGATSVHTLINTFWGIGGPSAYASIEFFGSEGAYHMKELIGNDDIRDYGQGYYTNYINGASTINVISITTPTSDHLRFDKQAIELPESFQTQRLDTIRLNDFGAEGLQRLLLYGLTIESASDPDLIASSLEWNTDQGGANFSYEVAATDLTQDTTAALYWAGGTTFDTVLGGPLYVTPIEHPVGQYGPINVSNADLGMPPPGATHLLLVVDPNDVVEESDEAHNIVSLGLPDLAGSSFHYTVLEDRTRVGGLRVADGPLPVNAHFDFNAVVANLGAGDAGPFTVSFYASSDARITTSDVPIAQATIDSLAGGLSVPIHFDSLQLPQNLSWTGTIHLGMILDADAAMPQVESRRDNNANVGDTIDRVIAQLYDPLPPVFIMATGFRAERQAALHLFRNGFLPQLPGTGRGWTKLLSSSLRFVSRRDGVRRSGLAYRQDAGIFFDTSTGRYFIEVQGSPTFGEPSPETAILHGPSWFAYVQDWHRRF